MDITVPLFDWLNKRDKHQSHFHHSTEQNYVQLRVALHSLHDAIARLPSSELKASLSFSRQLNTESMDYYMGKLLSICCHVESKSQTDPIRSIIPQLNDAVIYMMFCAKSARHTYFRQNVARSIKSFNTATQH